MAEPNPNWLDWIIYVTALKSADSVERDDQPSLHSPCTKCNSQAKALILDGVLDFQRNLVGFKGNGFGKSDKAKRKDFIKRKPKDDKTKLLYLG